MQPVKHPDPQSLSQLSGYEREVGIVMRNTEALLAGIPASNLLLYGDAGAGKSSTIKAVANALQEEGLRLIEVKKNQLFRLPSLLEQLAENPLKFIIFIDDLSFAGNDEHFAALKATLEGSVTACAKNTVIYATSNRRHLVKETMEERSGDDIHLNDTLQELMSLSARFGMTITFQKPDKDGYLAIVKHLAKEYNLKMPGGGALYQGRRLCHSPERQKPPNCKAFCGNAACKIGKKAAKKEVLRLPFFFLFISLPRRYLRRKPALHIWKASLLLPSVQGQHKPLFLPRILPRLPVRLPYGSGYRFR